MTAVDTGWINDEKPIELAAKHHQKHNFQVARYRQRWREISVSFSLSAHLTIMDITISWSIIIYIFFLFLSFLPFFFSMSYLVKSWLPFIFASFINSMINKILCPHFFTVLLHTICLVTITDPNRWAGCSLPRFGPYNCPTFSPSERRNRGTALGFLFKRLSEVRMVN